VSVHPTTQPIERFAAVIPAGGIGSRLWPLSRPDRPKFLLDLLGEGRSLLQATQDRLAPLAQTTLVVTGQAHVAAVLEQLPQLGPDAVLAEPTPRDSMAAIALAAAVLEHRHGPMLMGSFAADHVIPDAEAFHRTVRAAVEAARGGAVVTLGITPTGPSSAFGYIEAGAPLPDAGAETGGTQPSGALTVTAFTEKPDAATAAEFLATGRYYWNAGMFVMRTDVLLGHLERLQPPLAQGVRRIAAAWDGPEREAVMAQVWPTLTKIAIDHAIAEPVAAMGGVAVVPAAFEWDDVGDFDSLAAMLTPGSDGGIVVDRHAATVFDGAAGSMVVGGSRPVAIVGVEDVVVVDTAEALLITHRASAQRVKDASAAVDAARNVTKP